MFYNIALGGQVAVLIKDSDSSLYSYSNARNFKN